MTLISAAERKYIEVFYEIQASEINVKKVVLPSIQTEAGELCMWYAHDTIKDAPIGMCATFDGVEIDNNVAYRIAKLLLNHQRGVK